MCTLTFLPKSEDDFIVTSNRDEAPDRQTAPPAFVTYDKTQLLFPKDALAGGTWIGLSDHQRMICLLNGGFTAHEREDSYRMSRGIIVKELLAASNLKRKITSFDFKGIEPFTLISVSWKDRSELMELVWDGATPHFQEKPWKPTVWSSSLLYTNTMKTARETWFAQFLKEVPNPTKEELRTFHREAGKDYPEYSLVMDRGFVRTKSITQISKDKNVSMWYQTLPSGTAEEIIF
ncbi:MAG: hypothetical protein CMC35_04190 [Flavobacteriaceae bacterium]|nr:hypothetical protein [Flavobacteriaceae bacterium]|tara:strand:+ start:26038 stop:26739 length:702 start_codon:yes stop_codon:yes gene_type:complete